MRSRAEQAKIDSLVAEHSVFHSRGSIGLMNFTYADRKALFVGSHASHIVETLPNKTREKTEAYAKPVAYRNRFAMPAYSLALKSGPHDLVRHRSMPSPLHQVFPLTLVH